MKIKYIYTKNVGPLGSMWSIDLTDTWTQKTNEFVLFSGPNGSGKSIILKVIANLWRTLGVWMDTLKPQKGDNWFKQWYHKYPHVPSFAVIIVGVDPKINQEIGIFYGDTEFLEELRHIHPSVVWIGDTRTRNGKPLIRTTNMLLPLLPDPAEWFDNWRESRNKLLLTALSTHCSNIVHLDAEERHWIPPQKEVGILAPDDFRNRWLPTYHSTDNWKNSLESTLVNLKIVDQKRFESVVRDMNTFLTDKEISLDIHPDDQNRLRVIVKNSPKPWHYLDQLSAGERQVLILVFTISRWMEPGGIVLIDEPDLFLHPSLVRSLLARLEALVHKRNGQLIITSHLPQVWERYESIGKRIALGGGIDHE